MARRRSSGGRSAPRPKAHAPSRSPAKPGAAPGPSPAPVKSGSVMGDLRSLVAEGMAFGGGSAIAHRVVDAITGPRVVKHETVASSAPSGEAATMNSLGDSDACGGQFKAFQDCLNHYGSEISKCQFYMDTLSECRKNSGTGLNA